MERFPDWPQRLWRAIEERRDWPRQWGVFDCCLCTADLIEAQTGFDLARLFRGKYHDEAGARAILAAHGFNSLTDLGDASLPVRTERPRRGDAVLMPGPKGEFVGVVAMNGRVIAPAARRPIAVPLRGYLRCWSVG
jgi:hypothetical protein